MKSNVPNRRTATKIRSHRWTIGHSPEENESDLKVVLAFESYESRDRGLDIATGLQKDHPTKKKLTCHLWRWERFSSIHYAAAAAQQAAKADFIVLSCDGIGGLPDLVSKWLRLWSHRPRSKPATLIASVVDEDVFDPHWTAIRRKLAAELQGGPVKLCLLPPLEPLDPTTKPDAVDQLDAYGCKVPSNVDIEEFAG